MIISPADIERVKETADIVSVIGRHVELKRSGSSWKGLCPFHKEKTPSFHVNSERLFWKCYGCGMGGDVISFLVERCGLTFPEAVEQLAEEAGISLKPSRQKGQPQSRRTGLLEALKAAQDFYQSCMCSSHGEAAVSYLAGRGLAEMTEPLGIGYAPPGNALLDHLRASGFSQSVIEEAGLAVSREGSVYDRFRNRLTFPIRDRRGRVISFGARALDGDTVPKYLNGPETPVYSKGTLLYGYSAAAAAAREEKRVILVEGYFDHARLVSCGFPETVATCGTALSFRQARDLQRMAAGVYICYDGDPAGQKAAVSASSVVMQEGGYPRIVALPGGADPDDYLAARGREAFSRRLSDAPDPVSFCSFLLGGSLPSEGPRRVKVARRLIELVNSAKDPLVEEELLIKVEKFTGFSRTSLLKAAEDQEHSKRPAAPVSSPGGSLGSGDRAILRAATAGNILDGWLIRYLWPSDMKTEQGRNLLEELKALLDKGYTRFVFGEFSRESASVWSDIAGVLDSVTTPDIKLLKEKVEKRRSLTRRAELLEKLTSCTPDERELILDELADTGSIHDR